ncbi:site-specific DNA-methyltransferase [Corynebacterium amycolatum]|uniref:site-specific DNA-methyltransferase n=1 Tax=Corynebacterium amycolatum TaxID=43765 RepID=UPI00211A823B|nr:site-specific DNA-methyltransferase [Corynebacterium amycolatum]MCQ9167534.1 site-specific DNA-methyltransferase [Corynebacterium amycolatum]MCQ9174626.1 site-specific DNA-methyltransferase [Corynebacterium amycolatum]
MSEERDMINEVPGSTPEFRTELAAQLAELAPEAIADGKIDVEKLKELLEGDASDTSERFGLFWPGKKRAMRAAQTPTTATLRPDKENSKDWDTTKNVFIEGDNLEVLKILQKHYHGKIKMIYIDPPYNTGKDFVYPDNYKEGLESYLEWSKQLNEGGKKLSSNSESEGRYHSNWLNMMYPRLKLARNLLTNDGVIFISIDDHEVAQLRKLLDEIFGESNFIEGYIWESNFRPDNSSRIERENAQHVLCYARNKGHIQALVGTEKATDGLPSLTKNSMKRSTLSLEPEWVDLLIPDGLYAPGEKAGGYVLEDALSVQNGIAQSAFRITGRVIWSQAYLEDQVKDGTRIVIKSDGFVPYSKKTKTARLAPNTLIPREIAGDVLAGNAEIKKLFGKQVFNHPKPTTLLKYLIRSVMIDAPDGIVLDFFAGSGSTAHATMSLNSDDSGSRSCISVQLPEPVPNGSISDKMGFKTISEISRERLDRAGSVITKSLAGDTNCRENLLDTGFRSYKLADTNFTKWRTDSDTDATELEQHLLDLRESADDNATPDDLLTEILLKQGHSLVEQIRDRDIDGLPYKAVVRVDDEDGEEDTLVLAYLDEHTKPTLAQLRVAMEVKPAQLIMLEDAFQGDDELKTNLAQICKTNGIELWTA